MASVQVAVRVRPLNQREIDLGSTSVIYMEETQTTITNLTIPIARDGNIGHNGRDRTRIFTFDYSYWSCDENDPNYTSQARVFTDLGQDVIASAFCGYNACLLAYGQTSAGKSYTMMGTPQDQGLIPRICDELYSRMKLNDDVNISYRTEVSYFEIYNENVRDLLRPSCSDIPIRVREHPKHGPYVENLSKHLTETYLDIQTLIMKGNECRTVASTNMNDTSSRSHGIFTINFVQANFGSHTPSEIKSKINLVDLAGSERVSSSGASGDRLKEGCNINKSLVTLGTVISALALASAKKKRAFIPYRNSILTWLLKDSLGGNSKTIMIAAISPADVNHAETLSTLRYANRAKHIINKPTINEDPNVKLIQELRAEITRLKVLLSESDNMSVVENELYESERQMEVLTAEWTDRWHTTRLLLQNQTIALRQDGISVIVDSEFPYMISVYDDTLSTGVTLYHFKEGVSTLGLRGHITLSGVLEDHCSFLLVDGIVTLVPEAGALCMVNNVQIFQPIVLTQGCVIQLGRSNFFRYNNPPEAAVLRRKRLSMGLFADNTTASGDNLFTLLNPSLDRSWGSIYDPFTEVPDISRCSSSLSNYSDINNCLLNKDERHTVCMRKSVSLDFSDIVGSPVKKDQIKESSKCDMDIPTNETPLSNVSIIQTIDENMTKLKNNHEWQSNLIQSDMKRVLQVEEELKESLRDAFDTMQNKEQDLLKNIRIELELLDNSWKEISALRQREFGLTIAEGHLCPESRISPSSDSVELEIQTQRLQWERHISEERLKLERKRSTIDNLSSTEKSNVEIVLKMANDYLQHCDIEHEKKLDHERATLLERRKQNREALVLDLRKIKDQHQTELVHVQRAIESKMNFFLHCQNRIKEHEQSLEELQLLRQSAVANCEHESFYLDQEQMLLRDLVTRLNINVTMEDMSKRQLLIERFEEELTNLRYGSSKADGDNVFVSMESLEQRLREVINNNVQERVPFSNAKSRLRLNCVDLEYLEALPEAEKQDMWFGLADPRARASDDQVEASVRVAVPRYIVRHEGGPHHEYEVRVFLKQESWSVFRRYSRFRSFHMSMSDRYPELRKLDFPPRQVLQSFSEETARQRRRLLENYLRLLIATCTHIPISPLCPNFEISKTLFCEFMPFFRGGFFESSLANSY